MPPPVCGLVGSSGAGKTRLAQQLVPALAVRGLRVGYLKHAPHGADVDRAGSDTHRVRCAGAADLLLVRPDDVVAMTPRDREPPDVGALAARMSGCDVVLAEGFSDGLHPKIRIRPRGQAPREVAGPVLLDLEWGGDGVATPDLERAVDTVLRLVGRDAGPQVSVVADGVAIPVHGFAAEVVASGVRGIAAALRGVDRPGTLTVTVHRGSEGPACGHPPTG